MKRDLEHNCQADRTAWLRREQQSSVIGQAWVSVQEIFAAWKIGKLSPTHTQMKNYLPWKRWRRRQNNNKTTNYNKMAPIKLGGWGWFRSTHTHKRNLSKLNCNLIAFPPNARKWTTRSSLRFGWKASRILLREWWCVANEQFLDHLQYKEGGRAKQKFFYLRFARGSERKADKVRAFFSSKCSGERFWNLSTMDRRLLASGKTTITDICGLISRLGISSCLRRLLSQSHLLISKEKKSNIFVFIYVVS